MKSVQRTLVQFLFLVLLGLFALPALALDAKKGAMNLAKAAASAFEGGEMAKAARLYLEAYRMDAAESSYLYGAARAEQAAGQTEHAETHFRQFIGIKAADSDRVTRAIGYLDELAGLRSDEKVEAAERFARRNEWPLAAAAFGEAARLRPDRTILLYRAAAAAREAGDRERALEWLHQYLAKAPKDAADRGEAQLLLNSLTETAGPSAGPTTAPEPVKRERARALGPAPAPAVAPEAVPQPAPSVAEVAVASHPSIQRRAAWWSIGSGAAVAIAGLIVLAVGKFQESSFDAALNVQNGKVTGTLTDHAAAVQQANAIAGRETAGVALAGVGLAAAGAGLALLLTAPEHQVAVVPDGRSLLLAWRF